MATAKDPIDNDEEIHANEQRSLTEQALKKLTLMAISNSEISNEESDDSSDENGKSESVGTKVDDSKIGSLENNVQENGNSKLQDSSHGTHNTNNETQLKQSHGLQGSEHKQGKQDSPSSDIAGRSAANNENSHPGFFPRNSNSSTNTNANTNNKSGTSIQGNNRGSNSDTDRQNPSFISLSHQFKPRGHSDASNKTDSSKQRSSNSGSAGSGSSVSILNENPEVTRSRNCITYIESSELIPSNNGSNSSTNANYNDINFSQEESHNNGVSRNASSQMVTSRVPSQGQNQQQAQQNNKQQQDLHPHQHQQEQDSHHHHQHQQQLLQQQRIQQQRQELKYQQQQLQLQQQQLQQQQVHAQRQHQHNRSQQMYSSRQQQQMQDQHYRQQMLLQQQQQQLAQQQAQFKHRLATVDPNSVNIFSNQEIINGKLKVQQRANGSSHSVNSSHSNPMNQQHSNGSRHSLSNENVSNSEDLPEGIGRPLYVPAVIRKTEETIDLKEYYRDLKEKQRKLQHQQQRQQARLLTNQQILQRQQQQQQQKKNGNVSLSYSSNSQPGSLSSSPINNNNSNLTSSNVSTELFPDTIKDENSNPLSSTSNASLMNFFLSQSANTPNSANGGQSPAGSHASSPKQQRSAATSHNNSPKGSQAVFPSGKETNALSSISSSINHFTTHRDHNNKLNGADPLSSEYNSLQDILKDKNSSAHSLSRILNQTSNSNLDSEASGYTAFSGSTKKNKVKTSHWKPDSSARACHNCHREFNLLNRKHHCRNCGEIFCDNCLKYSIKLDYDLNFKIFNQSDFILEKNCTSDHWKEIGYEVKACYGCYKKYKTFLQAKLTEIANEGISIALGPALASGLDESSANGGVVGNRPGLLSRGRDSIDDFDTDDVGYDWSTF